MILRQLPIVALLIFSSNTVAVADSDSAASRLAADELPHVALNPSSDLDASEHCEKPAGTKCLSGCKTPTPLCGPRVRVIIPPPQVVFRKYCEPHQASAIACMDKCSDRNCGHSGFGGSPQGPAMKTIHVPYTYMVPVPTYAVVPFSNSFGSASMLGFGAMPTGGFGGINQFGSVAQLGGILPAGGFGGSHVSNDAIAKLISNMNPKKETSFGTIPEGDCKKDIAALNAKLEAMRSELTEFYKLHKDNDVKLKEAIIKLSEKLVIVNDKLGEMKDGKTLAESIAELDARITKLKNQNDLAE